MQFLRIETLQKYFLFRRGIPVTFERLQHYAGNVLTLGAMKIGLFDFRVDARVVAEGLVQPLYQLQLLFKGGQLKARLPQWESPCVFGSMPPHCGNKGTGDLQPLELIQCEVNGIEMPVLPSPVRKLLSDVRNVIQIDIVHHDQLIVLAQYQILLDIIRFHSIGQGFRFQGMFRQIPGCATVRNHDGGVFCFCRDLGRYQGSEKR